MFEPRLKSKGVLAQLVERFNGIEEVSGSTPLHSTFLNISNRIIIHQLFQIFPLVWIFLLVEIRLHN